MIKVAIVLVHNKSDQENYDQIETVKPWLTKQVQHNIEVDEKGDEVGTFDTYYYTIEALPIDHEVRFFQVFPFDVLIPSNKDDIDSYKVFYGEGDEDKTGDHPRFFNWGLKRATDFGADIVIHLDDPESFNPKLLAEKLPILVDTKDKTEYIEESFGTLSTPKLLHKVGPLSEDVSIIQARVVLKERVTEKGLKHG